MKTEKTSIKKPHLLMIALVFVDVVVCTGRLFRVSYLAGPGLSELTVILSFLIGSLAIGLLARFTCANVVYLEKKIEKEHVTNDIVKSHGIADPGRVLDLLDEDVTTTLRRDQGVAAIKDGMDIALCRIKFKTNTRQYSGADRPLYLVREKILTEIKGNKFPAGDGIYKNQTNFTTITINPKKGEAMYFSSGGFPDQFGVPEVQKLGPKKTRDIMEYAQDMRRPTRVKYSRIRGRNGEAKKSRQTTCCRSE